MPFKLIVIILLLASFSNSCQRRKDIEPDNIFRFEPTIKVGNLNRTYTVVLPSNYYSEKTDLPLVIAMHGGGGSAKQMEESYELPEKAEAEKYIIVYPDGIQSDGLLKARTWNAGLCCEYAVENDIDDVGFLSKMIDKLIADFNINPKQVFLTGMSNGGMMAYRLACEIPQKITAIAPVACTMVTTKPCTSQNTIPVLHFHSELDEHVPYEGGIGIRGINYPAVEKGLKFWAENNTCSNTSKITKQETNYKLTQWIDCKNNATVSVYLTKDGGHSWPGITKVRIGGDDPSTALNANELIFDFFNKYR
ncbi:phospholipase [Lacihabitans sp. LS3-19]|uniref:extracellular catalytic domain type 1 short-chain-length polyhydroxyalkanoate depolymerase n=1 Tax=Lacihabitans sp. LS3-19 TaxID=2487335 RepID=UPI0020CC3100|nr:PHB depolymerase family esterase [Lacihabitans sp. LS3-19]MCP9767948.1 phospholipase [Lacihabitans sp. LS3-19]